MGMVIINIIQINIMTASKITNVVVECIDHIDYPKFTDAFISSAMYDGKPMTESQLEELSNDSEFVRAAIINQER